jgi:hypothetical protein
MAIYRLPVKITHPALGGDGVNIFHVRTGGGIGEVATVNRAVGWLSTFYDAIDAVFPTGTAIQFEGTAVTVATEEPEYLEGLDTFNHAGAGGASVLPPANALVVGWRTSSATRSGRGRTFLGPMATPTAQADGTVTESWLSLVRTAAAAMVSSSEAADADGVALGVFSPTQNLLRDFTGSSVKDRFAVLRSRRD